MNDCYGRPMPPNPYEKNETMRLLGNQSILTVFWHNNEARKQINQIAEARPGTFNLDVAADIFALGYIHGKRAERQRRKKK